MPFSLAYRILVDTADGTGAEQTCAVVAAASLRSIHQSSNETSSAAMSRSKSLILQIFDRQVTCKEATIYSENIHACNVVIAKQEKC